ncbi:putative ribonuclease H-like domain-containing protein [Tanacetum coccineum]
MIVEYKIVKEGHKGFYHLIRADGSSKRYSSMIRMLQGIDREDLETLWKLVKEKHGINRPVDEYERVLWGDIKIMFEPDIKSEVWRSLQGYKVTVLKLFDSCGVHFIQKMNIKFRGGLLGLKDFKMILRVTTAQGIKREFSVARTPQQNGVAERKNRTLIEAARTMLADSKLPTTFWAEAINTACCVQNRVLIIKPHNKTPYELFLGRKHALSFMRPFGCPVTILNTLDHLVVTGNQTNGNAGTKENIDAGQAGKKIAEEGPTTFALMAYTSSGSSSSSSSDSEILKLDNKLRDNALTELRKKFEKAEKDRDDLKLTLEKFGNSSKNLIKLLEIQVSDKFKTGVGFDSHVVNSKVFDSQENDRYKTSEGYHVVPPPYTGNFMPLKYDLVLADEGEYILSKSVTSIPDVTTSEAKTSVSKPKFVGEPLIEDWISDSEDENETEFKSK